MQYKLKGDKFEGFSSRDLPSENAALKLKVEEMQRKIKILADRLNAEKSKVPCFGTNQRVVDILNIHLNLVNLTCYIVLQKELFR